MPGPKFPFGRVVITPGASEKLDHAKIDELLRLHGELDPGTLADEEDRIQNEFTVDGVGASMHTYRQRVDAFVSRDTSGLILNPSLESKFPLTPMDPQDTKG